MHHERIDRERDISACYAKSVSAHESERKLRYEAAKKILQKREITISTVEYNNLKANGGASKRI